MPAKPKAAAPSSNVWAYMGTDDLKVKEAAMAMARKLLPADAGEFGLEVIEGTADNVDHAERIIQQTIADLQTGAFFGGDKVVWLRAVNFLADTVTGRSPTTTAALEKLAELLKNGLPPDIKLILTASDVDKRKSFYLLLKKIAHLEVFDVIDTSKAGWEELVMQLVEQRAEEWEMQFESEALELFVMLAGEQTRQIDNELEKLDLYVGKDRAITADDVRLMVSKTKEGIIWDLGNAIGQRDLPRAMQVLEQLFFQGENAIGILLAAIVPRVRSLVQAKELAETYGVKCANYFGGSAYNEYSRKLEALPDEIMRSLPKKKDGGINAFTLFLAAKEMGKFTAAELRAALEECLTANRRLVTSSLDPEVVMSQLLIRMLSKPAKRAAAAAK